MKTRLILLLALSGALRAAEVPQTLKPVLQSFVDQNIAPGVVALVANKDGVLALETAGYAIRAKGMRMSRSVPIRHADGSTPPNLDDRAGHQSKKVVERELFKGEQATAIPSADGRQMTTPPFEIE